tara:strand:- start:564 stop:1106 length:543 start_codon:yes stop_codon:yes gene_type:complete
VNIEAKTENLPEIYPITPSDFSLEKNLKQLDKINFFQYRRKNTDKKIVKNDLAFLKKSLKVILNSCHKDFYQDDFFGMHLTSNDLMKISENPISKDKILGASCHNPDEINKALVLGVDYIFISPIRKNQKLNKALGWKGFKNICKQIDIPIFALGGVGPEDLENSRNNGGYGVSGIRKFW